MTTTSSKNTKQILSIIINSFIFVSTAIVATDGFFNGAGDGQLGNFVIGFGYFQAFTMDSNILAGIASLFVAICGMKSLVKKENTAPKWVEYFHLMGTTCLFLTIITVVLFLAPMEGKNFLIMFKKDMFFFHLLNPVLSIISFTLLQKNHRLTKKSFLFGLAPTVLYSVIYFLMVVVFKKWEDFYNFTFGGKYYLIPVVLIVMYSAVTGLSLLLIKLHNKNIE